MKKFRLLFLIFQLSLWGVGSSLGASSLIPNADFVSARQANIHSDQSTVFKANLPVATDSFIQNVFVDNSDDENDQDSFVIQQYSILSHFYLPLFNAVTVRLPLPHVIIKEPSIYIFLHAFRL